MPTLPIIKSHVTRLPPNSASPPNGIVPEQSGTVEPPPASVTRPAEPLPPILVADDDPDDAFFIERLIKKTGIENPVRTFDDGSEVVNFLGGARLSTPAGRLRCPRLLFLDLKMRGLGGFGFLEWARQQKELAPLTFVVLSSSNEPKAVAKSLELGAHRYLVKYPSVQTINTIVRSVYPLTVF
jgi:CheY-like chemotaxis protein